MDTVIRLGLIFTILRYRTIYKFPNYDIYNGTRMTTSIKAKH